MSAGAKLSVRPFEKRDIPLVVDYWTKLTPADVARMGIDPQKILTNDLQKRFEDRFALPLETTKSFLLAWEVDGQAVGTTTLSDLVVGKSGKMHLHIWNPALRGKGYGATLFCLGALDFYHRFQLQEILCEPRAQNPMPNRMLTKIGFPLQRSYHGKASEIMVECEINSYAIRRDIAESYLQRTRVSATPTS